MDYNFFMAEALKEAKKAFDIGEVPIGAVIVYEDEIVARACNRRTVDKNALYHAEILAIHEACKIIGDWRLEDCYMLVTVEPCPMCAGAIVQARMKGLVYGAKNKKAGSCGSVINLLNQEGFNHQVEMVEGIMAEECGALMSSFFANLRNA